MTFCSINGELVDASNAKISIQDRGFRFGDGVFETIALVGGVPYQFEWHMQRLTNGLKAIRIQYNTQELQQICKELLVKNNSMEGFLRIQVTRGIGSKGYLPDTSVPTVVIETQPYRAIPAHPVKLWKSNYTRQSLQSLPVQYKLCQGLNSTLARMEAQENGCFDALMLSEKGLVCETSSASIFWQKGMGIYTPSLSCGALEGSTRAAILRLSKVTEVEATLEELMDADAICITNVAWLALPVETLTPDKMHWQSQSFANHLGQMLVQDRQEYGKRHSHIWQNNVLE